MYVTDLVFHKAEIWTLDPFFRAISVAILDNSGIS